MLLPTAPEPIFFMEMFSSQISLFLNARRMPRPMKMSAASPREVTQLLVKAMGSCRFQESIVTECCQLFASNDEAHAIALILEASRTVETHPPAFLALIYGRRRALRPIDHDARRLANRNNTCGVIFGWNRALISDSMDATGGLMKG